MRSMRLNRAVKDEILNNVLKVCNTKNPAPEIDQANYDFAVAILKQEYKDFDDIMKMHKKHPELFTDSSWGIKVRIGTEFVRLEWNRQKYGSLPMPENTVLVSPDFPAYLNYQAVQEEYHEHQQKMNNIYKQAKTIIESCSTSRKLVEVWPEISPYVEPYIREGTVNLPTIPTKDINKILGW